MSELKSYTIYEGDVGNYTEHVVYSKSEADEVIAELEQNLSEIQSQKMQLEDDVALLRRNNAELKEAQRWRKFSEEKPTEEMLGEDFIVSNGYYSVVCEWRGYWNNEPFCGDKNCDDVKYWKPLTQAHKEGE